MIVRTVLTQPLHYVFNWIIQSEFLEPINLRLFLPRIFTLMYDFLFYLYSYCNIYFSSFSKTIYFKHLYLFNFSLKTSLNFLVPLNSLLKYKERSKCANCFSQLLDVNPAKPSYQLDISKLDWNTSLWQWETQQGTTQRCCFEQILEAVFHTVVWPLTNHPSKMIKHASHCWWSKDKLYNRCSINVGQPEKNKQIISCVWTLDANSRTCQEQWLIWTDGKRIHTVGTPWCWCV